MSEQLHDEFETVSGPPDPLGWNGVLWRTECKHCGWQGPRRYHPLDCGSDAVEHATEQAAA